MKKNSNIHLGKNCKIDEHCRIGQEPLRKPDSLKLKIDSNAICMSGSVIYLGSKIGKNLIIAHNAIIREENLIGNDLSLWNNSVIDYACVIGSGVKIHCNCYVAQFTRIEDNVFLAPGVIISNDIHPGCRYSLECLKGAVIKKGAQVGCNVTILPGVTIGRNAMIGAGSVVTEDVPAGKVVFGNPAKIIKPIGKINCLKFPGKNYRDLNSL